MNMKTVVEVQLLAQHARDVSKGAINQFALQMIAHSIHNGPDCVFD